MGLCGGGDAVIIFNWDETFCVGDCVGWAEGRGFYGG